MYKIHHTKKVMAYLNVFRKFLGDRQDVSDGIQTRIYFIKDEHQNSIQIDIYRKK